MSRVAVIQMCSGVEWQDNLRRAYELLRQAAEAGAQLAALPENFVLMGRYERDKYAIAETPGQGPIQQWLADTARELKLWIVGGTLPLKLDHDSRVAPACLVVNEYGEQVARYDKMHLFDVDVADAQRSYRESSTMAPGHAPVVVDTPVGRLGLAICYDVRFPELFRHLSAAGAQLFTLPAAFTVPTGRAHWDILLRARAIENLCYLLAPGQAGLHANGRETYGHSMIIDPWGEVLAAQDQGEGVVVADLDLDQQRDTRERFPALSHRRL